MDFKRQMMDGNMMKHQFENNDYYGVESSLSDEPGNYTELFKSQLKNCSTPITNVYKSQPYVPKDANQYTPNHSCVPHQLQM